MASPLVICKPHLAVAVAVSTGAGGDNLLTNNPKEAWLSGSSGAVYAILDLGSAKSVNFIYLGAVNGVADTTWSATYSAASSAGTGSTALASTTAVTPRRSGKLMNLVAMLPAPITARFIRVNVDQGSGGPNLTAGILRAGLCLQPTWGQEWGGGRAPIDTGSSERLLDGGFGIEKGVKKALFQWTFGDLSDAEREALYDFCEEVGETDPFVLVEDIGSGIPTANEGTHWCKFDRLDYYERRDPASSRWSFRVEEWV